MWDPFSLVSSLHQRGGGNEARIVYGFLKIAPHWTFHIIQLPYRQVFCLMLGFHYVEVLGLEYLQVPLCICPFKICIISVVYRDAKLYLLYVMNIMVYACRVCEI